MVYGKPLCGFWWKHQVYLDEEVIEYYRQTFNIIHNLAGNEIVHPSDVVGESPVGATTTASSFST